MCQQCAEDESIQNQLTNVRLMGVFFGYPQCCVDWFVERTKAIRMTIAHGGDPYEAAKLPENQNGYTHGFIPCPECAKTVQPGTEHNLIEHRFCNAVYPADDYKEEELKDFVELLVKV